MVNVRGGEAEAARIGLLDGDDRVIFALDAPGVDAILTPRRGAADHAAATDDRFGSADADRHHAGDRPVILAAAVVVLGAAEIGSDQDDQAARADGGIRDRGVDNRIDSGQQARERRPLAVVEIIVVVVGIEATRSTDAPRP